MKTSFKKLVAGASIVALVAMNTLLNVNAAAINNATSAASADTHDIEVTSAGAFAASASCTAMVSKNGAAAVSRVCAQKGGDTANTLVITDPDGTVDGGIDAGYYVITFATDNGVFGSVTYDNGTGNDVTVSATVVPTLTMSLSSNTLAMGTLTTAGYQTATLDVVTATNAVGGADVTMASVGLKDTVVDREIGVTDISTDGGGAENTAATDYYKISTNAAPVFTDVNDALANAGGTDMGASQVVLNGSTPTNSTTTTKITVGSKIGATTESGNYSDTLTFTVVGTF